MANNIQVKDGNAVLQTMKTTDNSGVHTPHHIPSIGGSPVDTGNPLPVSIQNTPTMSVSGAVEITNDAGNPLPVSFPTAQSVTISGTPNVSVTGSVEITNDSGSAIPVSSAQLPTLAVKPPNPGDNAVPVRAVGQETWVSSFAAVGASVLSSDFNAPIVGTGVGYSQAGGSLLITTGTTANAEFLARSVANWRQSLRMRASVVASQRIANQNLAILLADLVGEGLAYSIVNATTVDVTLTAHGFTSQNVGQFMLLGGITGAAGIPGRYAIASIPDANTIRFTVASWPASGSGTLTLFGWNFVRHLFTGTTATAMAATTQRRGWADADTTATINTTASPGTIIQTDLTGRDAFFMDSLRASVTAPVFASRASRYENLPDEDVPLHLFLWSFNGSTAPASTTTWTIGFAAVERFANQSVFLQGVRAQGSANSLPVTVQGTATVTFTQPALVAGTAAIGDVGQQYRANATGAASGTHIVSAASTNATVVKAGAGRVLGWHLANTTASWKYVKLHNQATSPTAGSGVVRTIGIPPNGVADFNLEGGIAFSTGIGLTIVTGSADADATAVAAADVVGDLFFA